MPHGAGGQNAEWPARRRHPAHEAPRHGWRLDTATHTCSVFAPMQQPAPEAGPKVPALPSAPPASSSCRRPRMPAPPLPTPHAPQVAVAGIWGSGARWAVFPIQTQPQTQQMQAGCAATRMKSSIRFSREGKEVTRRQMRGVVCRIKMLGILLPSKSIRRADANRREAQGGRRSPRVAGRTPVAGSSIRIGT